MASKNDKINLDFNLDALEAPEEAREYHFALRGKQFRTVNPAQIAYDDLAAAYRLYAEKGDQKPILDLFLGEQAKDFWAARPSVFQVMHIGQALDPVMRAIFGESGESNDS